VRLTASVSQIRISDGNGSPGLISPRMIDMPMRSAIWM
jgi:hypothetical protein